MPPWRSQCVGEPAAAVRELHGRRGSSGGRAGGARAAQVALVEPPDFSYGLVVQGGDLTFLPGLESWLNSFIKTSLLQPYILPDGVTVDALLLYLCCSQGGRALRLLWQSVRWKHGCGARSCCASSGMDWDLGEKDL